MVQTEATCLRSFQRHGGPAFVGFLLPPEVVSCSYLPEPGLRAHCVRLLREQWESEARHLAVIPEDGSDGACVLGEDKLQESQEAGQSLDLYRLVGFCGVLCLIAGFPEFPSSCSLTLTMF